MNRKIGFSLLFTIFLILGTNVVVFAQASGDGQRLVGTWTEVRIGATVVFNSDGTVSGFPASSALTHWVAAGDRVFIFQPNTINYFTFDFRISNDGRIVIMNTDGLGTQRGWTFRRN